MKQNPLFSRHHIRSQSGMALIIVLALVVLITALMVGFLVISGLEMNSSSSYKASSNDRLLADTTINLVQGQINEATSQGPTNSWASQPGAIWVFNSGNSSNDYVQNIYKLYSSPLMTTTNPNAMCTSTTSASAGVNDMPPTTWASDPSIWVDLNASATDAQGNVHYPILNPAAAANVDGFSIDTTNSPFGESISSPTTDVPMPVQWLYVLQNGQVIPPDTSSTSTATTFAHASAQPSSTNPIVGRIAFWTDDETCKVNINTAGGDGLLSGTNTTAIANATFWDTPRYFTSDEVTNALYQPMEGEFQRYPGHPGTIALNNVLYGLGWTNLENANLQVPSTNFYTVTPRYALGGSEGATISDSNGPPPGTEAPGGTETNINLNPSPQNRLYPSVAEMLFNYQRTPSEITAGSAASSTNTEQQVETARFFLTAHNEEPEVTLFGQPRVSMWPVWSTASASFKYRTPIDNTLAYCATVPGSTPHTYYFTRSSAVNSTTDITLEETNNEYRNQMLLNYLDYYTSQPIPGYGGQFNTKPYVSSYAAPFTTPTGFPASTSSRQILTEIFDYIRTINEADTSQLTTWNGVASTSNPCWYASYWDEESGTSGSGYYVAPSLISSSDITSTMPLYPWTQMTSGTNTLSFQGIAATPRLSEVALQFVALSAGALPTATGTAPIAMSAFYGYPGNTEPAEHANFAQGDTATSPESKTGATTNEVSEDTNLNMPNGEAGTPNPDYEWWSAPGSEKSGSTTTVAMQAFLFLSFTQPSQMIIDNGVDGSGGAGCPVTPFFWVQVSGANAFSVQSTQTGGTVHSLGFPASTYALLSSTQTGNSMPGKIDEVNFGNQMLNNGGGGNGGKTAQAIANNASAATAEGLNPLFGTIFPVLVNPQTGAGTMTFTGGPITIDLYDGAGSTGALVPANWHLIQTYTINFGAPTTYSTPSNPWTTATAGTTYTSTLPVPTIPSQSIACAAINSSITQPAQGPRVGLGNWGTASIPTVTNATYDRWAVSGTSAIMPGDVVQSMVLSPQWSDARMLSIANVPPTAYTTHPNWGNWANSITANSNGTLTDTAPTALVTGGADGIPYGTNTNEDPQFAWAYELTSASEPYLGSQTTSGLGTGPTFAYATGVLNPYCTSGVSTTNSVYNPTSHYYTPFVPATLTSSNIFLNSTFCGTNGQLMDWDTGQSIYPDGPWVNKVDEGQNSIPPGGSNGSGWAYFHGNNDGAGTGGAGFTPNREVPSPGVLGSLPTGIDPTGNNPRPWQTLLFRPNPGHIGASVTATGAASSYPPPDHLWLDLFWMPVTEPYAISQPFSSEGKVNLNYEIEPFTYITRSTALRAALNTLKIASVSVNWASAYHGIWETTGLTARYPMNVPVTLQQFQDKFDGLSGTGSNSGLTNPNAPNPDVFHSASQICEMYLVPRTDSGGNSYSKVSTFASTWYDGKTYGLVGDNVREKPYADLYGLVTTKSNTFTVYYTVQSLKNAEPAANQYEWNESLGTVRGEYRGSTTIERYIDPNQSIPDFAAATATVAGTTPTLSLDGNVNAAPAQLSYYKWRIVENHQFAP